MRSHRCCRRSGDRTLLSVKASSYTLPMSVSVSLLGSGPPQPTRCCSTLLAAPSEAAVALMAAWPNSSLIASVWALDESSIMRSMAYSSVWLTVGVSSGQLPDEDVGTATRVPTVALPSWIWRSACTAWKNLMALAGSNWKFAFEL